MVQTHTPGNNQEHAKHGTSPETPVYRGAMVALTLSLSWQLAVIVLVPLIGGYKLDDRFHTMPWLTLLGLIVALAGMILVVKRVLRRLNELMTDTEKSTNP